MSVPMTRCVAFLRGVSPMNAKMPALKQAFEAAGFTEVRTLLSSGNVAFGTGEDDLERLRERADAAMQDVLGRRFDVFIRRSSALKALIDADPFAAFDLPPQAKRVLTFLKAPVTPPAALPITQEGARILAVQGTEVLSAYLPTPGNPVFMRLLERHFGRDITTRTWDTVRACAGA